MLVGHSYSGGIALLAAATFPFRVCGLVLITGTDPDCLSTWDRVLGAPVIGAACAITTFGLGQWAPRVALAVIERRTGRPPRADEDVDLVTWAEAHHEHGHLWRTFLIEQRDLVRNGRDLGGGAAAVSTPTVVLADPDDDVVAVRIARALHRAVEGSRLQLVEGGGHALPRTSRSSWPR